MHLAHPANEAISLANDIYSWPKERVDAAKSGWDYIFNAVWVIMRERHCDAASALCVYRNITLQLLRKYKHIVDDSQDLSLSLQIRQYFEAVRQGYVGNLVWGIYCPSHSNDGCRS